MLGDDYTTILHGPRRYGFLNVEATIIYAKDLVRVPPAAPPSLKSLS